jgi:hypothetical protein
MPKESPHGLVKAQLRSASDRYSKVIKDRQAIEVVVEVAGAGKLMLEVDGAGGYSLRGCPEATEAQKSRNLLAAGVMRSEGIVAIRPERASSGSDEHDPDRGEALGKTLGN